MDLLYGCSHICTFWPVVGSCAVCHAVTAGLAGVCVVLQEPTEERPAAPDSTTRERSGFSEGEDVLFQHKDGRYYLGTIVEVRTELTKLYIE